MTTSADDSRTARLLATLRGPSEPRQRLFALSTIVNTIGMGIFISAGTIFLIRSAGLSPTTVGIGLTVGSLVGVGAGVLIGDLADRRGAREVVVVAMALEAIASLGLVLVDSLWSLIAVATLAAVGRTGSVSARGALIGILAEEGKGAQLRTYLRAVTNVGLAIGTLGAAAVLAFDTRQAYLAMIIVSTLTFLGGAAILSRLPHLPPTRVLNRDADARPDRRWIALRDRHYLGLTAAAAVASLQYSVLIQALPVWIVLRTESPRWMAAMVMFVASVLVAALQVPATRSIDGPRSAARLLVRSGPLFLVAWILMAYASGPSAWIATGLLLVGVVVHSLAEVWQAAGTFELSFALARPDAHGQYQGVMGLGHGIAEAVAPAVVITLCISAGKLGWVALGVIVTVAGVVCAMVERHWAASRATPAGTLAAEPSAG
ncbi:MFS transporter [Catellatospora methionotrophica]|uniref:MFS transporter n=1 Tax=Catellatospora methionotrophica TaxID=121620 RepID=A0A8J3L977_9ACTN|nr:MFS transporter [Catellatospora methionotrophica]GIG16703.1 MFS transporter [Catellatospora methionotrophica]